MDAGRGARLFAEPAAEDSIRVLDAGQGALEPTDTFTLSIPLYLPKKIILRRFKELLDERHQGKPGYQLAKKSKAHYRVVGQPNIPAIEQAIKVYDFRKANPQLKLWEIGNRLPRFQLANKIIASDTPSEISYKKTILAVTVSRYLKRAEAYIENVGLGSFPQA
jgi:hypothetical protein